MPPKPTKSSGPLSRPLSARIPRRWAWHHRTLTDLRGRLQSEHDESAQTAAKPTEAGGADQVDRATDDIDREEAFSRLTIEENTLTEVEAALERLQRGTYGICEATGQAIPAARLRAMPWCRYTLEAEKSREHPGT